MCQGRLDEKGQTQTCLAKSFTDHRSNLFHLGSYLSGSAGNHSPSVRSDQQLSELSRHSRRVIVVPKFGGEILGYDIDRNGNEGLLSEAVALSGGANLVATETFDQRTGAILKVVAKEKRTTQDDYVTAGIFGHIGLDLFQHAGQNHFLTVDPLSGGKFSGKWSPPIKKGYQLWTISVGQDTPDVAAYQSSFDTGLTYVFSSNVAKNTFGRQISLKSIINVNEFFHPAIALDTKTNQAVLADSQGCSENCISSIALVNLVSGKIVKFTAGLGNGTVNGLAVYSRNPASPARLR